MAQRQRAGLITPRSLDRDELPVLFNSQVYKNLPRCQYSTHFTDVAQRQRVRLITARTYDRNVSSVFYIRRFIRTYHAVTTATTRSSPSRWTLNKHEWCEPALPRLVGDVKRNNTYDGILIDTGCRLFSFAGLQESATLSIQQPNLFTAVAQRKRAGLITPRSPDRNGSAVLFNSQVYKNLPRCQYSNQPHFTGMAQRQRAGLITPRSLDQNQLPVFSYSCALQKHAVIAMRR